MQHQQQQLQTIQIEEMSPLVDSITFRKMVFFHNALNHGWTIKKRNDCYIFSKQHEGRKEILDDGYLTQFIQENNNLEALFE